ncbi:MAG: hypothetical protein CL840_01695 [Crocinitomicaceae bacterium]|nr:hypothetical protein [Crocinitomicaceae bacterium]|tara:strand:+ start:186 stop:1526 length:1341 start_codon:yes stop_codon:yes gene_type:complete
MKTLLLRLTVTVSLIVASQQLQAQSFTPISSPSYPFLRAECDGGKDHYLLFEKGYPNDTVFLYRFDGINFYPIDSFRINPYGTSYCIAYYNNEIYIGGGFDTINGNILSKALIKYSLSNKTITKSNDIFPGTVMSHEVFDMVVWGNKFLMGGTFEVGGLYTPLIVRNNSTWSAFDNSVYGNGGTNQYHRIHSITVEDSTALYIAGDFKQIDQLVINQVAHYKNGKWKALGNGLPNSATWGVKTGLAKQNGKIFVSHINPSNHGVISYFDGISWDTLRSRTNELQYLLASSCGLFVIVNNTFAIPNGLALYDNQLGFDTLTGVTTRNMHRIFEYNGSIYVHGYFFANSQYYKFGKVDCTPLIQSISGQDTEETESIFPNPFSSQFTLTYSNNEPVTLVLYDFNSRQILEQTFSNSTTINTGQMRNGMYFYELRNAKGTLKTGKLIKQ